jgi:hypothetical protein
VHALVQLLSLHYDELQKEISDILVLAQKVRVVQDM